MKRKVLWLVLTLLLATTLVLSSCTKNTTTGSSTTTAATTAATSKTTSNTTAVTTKVTTTTTASASTPVYGGSLTYFHQNMGWSPQGFDNLQGSLGGPFWQYPYVEFLVGADIEKYGPRGNNQYAFQSANYLPEQFLGPELAQSWEITTTTMTFHLQKGVMWTGNANIKMPPRELIASDVVFSLSRAMNSPITASRLNFIKAITAPETYTVVFELNRYDASWPDILGGQFSSGIISPEQVAAGADQWQNAVGTGPFIITDYVEGAGGNYKANPNYRGTTTINGKKYKLPFIDTYRLPVIPDESSQIAAIRTGKIDWFVNVPAQYGATLTKSTPDLIQEPYLSGHYSFARIQRLTNEYLSNKTVRQALLIGTDLNAITKLFYPGGSTVSFPLVPSDPAYTPLDQLPAVNKQLWTYDPTLAKKMIADAGYPNGFTIELKGDATAQDLCSTLAAQWAKIGVTAQIQVIDLTTLIYDLTHGSMKGLICLGGDINNPLSGLNGVRSTVAGNCYTSADGFDAMYTACAGETDPLKRSALEKDMALAVQLDAGEIPFANVANLNCYYPYMMNYYGEVDAGAMNVVPLVARIWIDKSAK